MPRIAGQALEDGAVQQRQYSFRTSTTVFLVPVALAVAAVIAAHGRLDHAGVGRCSRTCDNVDGVDWWSACVMPRTAQSRRRRGAESRAPQVPRDRVPDRARAVLVGHVQLRHASLQRDPIDDADDRRSPRRALRAGFAGRAAFDARSALFAHAAPTESIVRNGHAARLIVQGQRLHQQAVSRRQLAMLLRDTPCRSRGRSAWR
jgi:hypothetical protein